MVPLDIVAAGITGGGASLEVVSDIPVVVGQWLSFATPDLATPLGIPVIGTQSLPLDLVGPGVLGDDTPVAPPPDGTDPSASESTTTAAPGGAADSSTTTAAGT
jgi:hypothetical protein